MIALQYMTQERKQRSEARHALFSASETFGRFPG